MIAFSTQPRERAPFTSGDDGGAPVPVVVYLSGLLRGKTLRLDGERLRIGTAPDAEIQVPALTLPQPAAHHATLVRRGRTFQLVAEPGCDVWVNGEPAHTLALASGDLLELGRDGTLFRFRLYPPGSTAAKSLPEVFADCMDCARYSGRGTLGKAGVFVRQVPGELATQTSLAFRSVVAVALVVLGGTSAFALMRDSALEGRVAQQTAQLGEMGELLASTRRETLTPEDLRSFLAAAPPAGLTAAAVRQMREDLQRSDERIRALEGRAGAAERVAAAAGRATALVLGSYGFTRPSDGRGLRFLTDPDGRPVRGFDGQPEVTFDGDGPLVEMQYTGTAFLVSTDGLVVTNRHVAVPWDYDPMAQALVRSGLSPAMTRYVAYLPAQQVPISLQLLATGKDASTPDVAILRLAAAPRGIDPLPMRAGPPATGEEVLLVGYPLGIRAIVARSGTAFVEALQREGGGSMWDVARKLSDSGLVSPLVTRGIVGQVTSEAITYDAQTTSGGSGGPVLDREGRVVAVNMAVLPDFAGSNLGVPAARIMELLSGLATGRTP